MPLTKVVIYQESPDEVPVLAWLTELKKLDAKGWANCLARIEQLAASGHELRRPAADFLRDGIYELRAKHQKVQYRILYFFHGRNVAILGHATTKRDSAVDDHDIETAISRMNKFKADPKSHTYEEDRDGTKNKENKQRR